MCPTQGPTISGLFGRITSSLHPLRVTITYGECGGKLTASTDPVGIFSQDNENTASLLMSNIYF